MGDTCGAAATGKLGVRLRDKERPPHATCTHIWKAQPPFVGAIWGSSSSPSQVKSNRDVHHSPIPFLLPPSLLPDIILLILFRGEDALLVAAISAAAPLEMKNGVPS